uniref:Uncharacterized protein n=1 Tax=Oncorhynchus tshawytscha TaxID=74940 RepID=A0AAZ3QI62_ONCTS
MDRVCSKGCNMSKDGVVETCTMDGVTCNMSRDGVVLTCNMSRDGVVETCNMSRDVSLTVAACYRSPSAPSCALDTICELIAPI